MTNISANIGIDLSGMRKYTGELPIRTRRILEMWVIRYRTFIQRRFDRFSKGGGDWAPLKYRSGTILRDTNTLFTAMSPTLTPPPGSVNIFSVDSVEIGFGGQASHPGGPTIRQIAEWHHNGDGNLPIRQIIVIPPQSLINSMANDAHRELNR